MNKIKISANTGKSLSNEFLDYPELIIRLLLNRNILDKKSVNHFFNDKFEDMHDPYLFKDMEKVCDYIYEKIKNRELIYLYGDYDADGISGVVILEKVLKSIDGRVKVYIPHREKDGYGLSKRAIDQIKKDKSQLIITCDCGMSNLDEITYAVENGIQVIVTDHHQIPDVLPEAYAFIHPKRKEETYPDKNLAGGGVAYKLAQGLLSYKDCKLKKNEVESIQKWLLDLAAISTVADMVPLVGENRIIAKYGLLVLKKNQRLGLSELFLEAKIDPTKISADVIGYQIAPRINAAGRMGDAVDSYNLLAAEDKKVAEKLAKQVNQQNINRQQKTIVMYNEAVSMLEGNSNRVIVLYNNSWLPGLTGLVAGKLSNKFNIPAFVITKLKDYYVGSGRSPEGISVMDGMNHVKKDLVKFGGHTQACGFRIDPNMYEKVKLNLEKFYNKLLLKKDLAPIIKVESEVKFTDLSSETTSLIEKFKPFGQENPEPLLYTKKVEVISVRHVGAQAQHVKLILKNTSITFPAIAFNKSSHKLQQGDIIDIVYYCRINEWNGSRETQLVIQDLKING